MPVEEHLHSMAMDPEYIAVSFIIFSRLPVGSTLDLEPLILL